jgi:serine/threonine protein kinase
VWLLVFGGVSTVDDVKDWQDQQMMSDMIIIELGIVIFRMFFYYLKRIHLLVKWENENWMSTVVFDSSLVGITTDDYTRKLMDRVFQGRKDWIQVVTSKKMLNEEQGSVDVSSDETSYVIERDVIIDDGKKHQTTSQSKDFVYENVSSKDILLGDTKDPPLSERMQLKRSEEECQRVKVELKECEERLLTTEKKLEDFHEEAHQEMLRLRNELSSLHLSREINWKVNEDEVTINEKKLSLRTGDVYNGCYRMTGVSCKRLNDIPSQEEFKMSMDIMSQLRHPNLVLFIGATVGDNPLIITESIPFQPLNYRLKESSLPRDQLISIAIDTSRGLSYLHHLSPSPITHGSISSESIYIDDSSRAKIADTGLYPHIIKQPLLPTHTPPEIALNSITHSAAIDVYGFGVTLIEMCCPDGLGASYNEHLTILGQIDWPKMIPIIQNCIQPNPVDRPSITNTLILIQELLQ